MSSVQNPGEGVSYGVYYPIWDPYEPISIMEYQGPVLTAAQVVFPRLSR